jgi:hypothetical protein
MDMRRCKLGCRRVGAKFRPIGTTESAPARPRLDQAPWEGPSVCVTARRRAIGIPIRGVKKEIPVKR